MGHKILLADDSITIQKVIELTFSDEDFELHTVGNGQKAIDEIRSILPDVVLCDIIMPEKNGYEVCEFIKTSDDLKHIPVLLLTGAFEPFDQERAKAAGCDGFLAKPFEPQTLIAKVKELLASTAGSAVAGAAAPVEAPTQPAPVAGPPQPAPPVQPAPPAQPAQPEPPSGEETVFAAPPVTPPAPDAFGTPPAAGDEGGLGQGFVAEAGERELSMGPEDHTVLLGQNEAAEAVPAPTASDDIWGQVAAPPPDPEEDSATVFMKGPSPVASESTETSSGSTATEMNDPDTTWQMPPKEPASTPPAASPPQTPTSPPAQAAAPTPVSDPNEATGDFGGFEEFASTAPEAESSPAAPEPTSSEDAGATFPATPPTEPTPPAPTPPSPPSAEVPQVADSAVDVDTGGSDPFPPLEPMDMDMGSDEVAAIESLGAGPAHPAPEGATAGAPQVSAAPTESPQPPAGEVAGGDFEDFMPAETVQMPSESGAPEGDMVFEPPPLESAEPELLSPALAAAGNPTPAASAPPEPPTTSAGASGESADEDLVERVAQRVVDKLSAKVIQEIAWEVVPDLAEGLIKREIEALKAKIPE